MRQRTTVLENMSESRKGANRFVLAMLIRFLLKSAIRQHNTQVGVGLTERKFPSPSDDAFARGQFACDVFQDLTRLGSSNFKEKNRFVRADIKLTCLERVQDAGGLSKAFA